MAQTIEQLRSPGLGGNPLNELLARPMAGGFDPDAWHVMQERDNALIRDEILHGHTSDAFVYSFQLTGSPKPVTGISVIGARELASQYKGIKSRIVATVEKRGSLFIFRTFTPLSIETRVLDELAGDDDFYECVMEVSDIKTGNSIEVRKKESRTERKRDGTTFQRPHYDVIAESKAYRNGVLAVLPQSVINDFKQKCLQSGKNSNEQTIQQRRQGVITFASKNGLSIDRSALNDMGYAEMEGLSAAAQQGLDSFKRSAAALGLVAGLDRDTGVIEPQQQARAASPTPAPAPARATAPTQTPAAAPERRAAAAPVAKPSFDVEAFADSIDRCTDEDTLNLKADEVSSLVRDGVISEAQGEDLHRVYHHRLATLNGQGDLIGGGQPASAPAAAPAQQTTRRRSSSAGTAPE